MAAPIHLKTTLMDNVKIPEADLCAAKEELRNAEAIDTDILFWDRMNEPPANGGPMRMGFLLVSLCTEGTASLTIDAQKCVIESNDIILIPEGHVIDEYEVSPDFNGLCMMMTTSFFYDTMRNVSDLSSMLLLSRTHPVVRLAQRETDIYKSYFELLKAKTADRANRFRRHVVQALIQAMFYDLGGTVFKAQAAKDRQPRADAIFANFIMLVEQNFKSERRVAWYADRMCISPKYLADSIKSASKCTPNEWIDKYVIFEIKLRLRNTAKSIKEIATEMSFPNQSFFGKFFKEHTGVSPTEYRKVRNNGTGG